MNNNEGNNNNNQTVVAVEKNETNILAVLGLVFAFFIPIVGLILSIVGLSKSKICNNGRGLAIGGIVVSAIVLVFQIIVIIFVVIVFLISDFDYDYDYDYYDYDYAYRESFNYPSTEDGKYYIAKNSEDIYYATTTIYEYTDVVYTYECESLFCKVFDASKDYALVYDNKDYFLYNYKKDKKMSLDIPYQMYNDMELLVGKKSETVGLALEDRTNDVAVYNLDKEKMVVDFGNYESINTDSNLIRAGYVVVSNDEFMDDKRLVSLDTGKVEKEGIYGALSNDSVTYFYDINGFYEDISKIYSSDFKLIVDFKEEAIVDYYLNEDGRLFYSFDKKFNIVEKNKISYTSKAYDQVYNVIKDYVIVNKNDNLVLLDYKENEIANLAKLTKDMTVHTMLSGWYTENGKNGIYVVVEDFSLDCTSLDRSYLEKYYDQSYNEAYQTCQTDAEGFGYEFYYIPKTKETGKINTIIGGYAKPVLYLYPENDNTKVKVSFEHSNLLTTTYPKYNKYWSVIANKNGDLKDNNGRYYYGLYWEEMGSTKVDFSEGFYVDEYNAIDFLEEKLEIIGFNEREANEFIMYWLPILEKNKHNLVYFELTEERENYNKIKIEPTPDSLLRVAIHVKKVDGPVDIKEEKLTTFNRHGFAAVEWGGVIH